MTPNAPGPIYPLSALRATVLYAQHLATPRSSPPAAGTILNIVKALGYVQIDTLQVVNRAHFITLWARLGAYDLDRLRDLLYAPGRRRLYEGWGHAAGIIPLDHRRYHRWRTDKRVSFNPGYRDWAQDDANRALAEAVLARIREEGPLRVADFRAEAGARGDWFDWRPAKDALEALFAWGDLMVADRVNFQRVYDLRERVLPAWVDTTPVEPEAGRRWCLEQAARALGVFEPSQLTNYAYMRAIPARVLVQSLIEDGILVEIQGEATGGPKPWHVHRDSLPLLQRAADGEITATRTTFLSPFDSLLWAPGRDEALWGFAQRFEAYKPAAKRVYGYYNMPILHGDRLVGRFDPKLDRASGVLSLNALHLEPGCEPDEALLSGVAAAMRDFLAWHGATGLVIHKSAPPAFGELLLKAL